MDGKSILRRIVEGLEGVTAGTWVVRETTVNGRGYGGHWLEVANDDNMICISGSGGARSYTMRVIDTQIHDDNEPNLRHFARCSPDAILAIAAYVAAVEKERDELRAALEPAAIVAEHEKHIELNPVHIRLLQSGTKWKWISLSNESGRRMAELAALGELERAGLVRPTEDELPPGPPVFRPREITDAGRAALKGDA